MRRPLNPFSLLCGILFLLAAPPDLFPAGPAEELPSQWTPQSAVRFALANNPETAIIRERIAAARAAVMEADSAFYPRLDLSASYSRTDNPMYSFGNILNQGEFDESIDFNAPGTTDNLNMAATASYRLYNGGSDQAGLRVAEASETASRHEMESVRARLAFEVIKTFFTILQAEDTVQARQSAVGAAAALVSVAQARCRAGDLLQADLLNLEVHHAEEQENLIQARHGLQLARRAFLNLLGLEEGTVLVDRGSPVELQVPAAPDIALRPELMAMEAAVQAAEARVRQEQGGYYPTADAFAGYQVDQGYELDGSGNSWLAGVKVNFNLFSGRNTAARIAGARAVLAEKKEQLRKISLAIRLEVEQASLAVEQTEQRMEVTEKMVAQAQESARLSRERFKEGVILSSELIDVENRLTGAVVRRTAARTAHRIAVADFRRACGLPQFDQPSEDPANPADS
ncbi:MAG: TolC family protein [Desulfobulbaceae bacterium]|jgi:outer membrane protein TolC|nr:TolC family protein [Desulfobulbaceae bacterium]MDY0350219.1 TolC family protein [Desulfobulbaceae bacterium]